MRSFPTPFGVIDGKVATTESYDQIVRCQLLDALTTNQGERVMFPEYGCNVQSALFNPASALERADAASAIKSRLQGLVPRALVETVTLSVTDEEPNVVYIRIRYKASRYLPLTDLDVTLAIQRELAP